MQRTSQENFVQIVVPTKLFHSELSLAHDAPLSGYQGPKKTLHRDLQRFWRPKVRQDVTQYNQSCLDCAERMLICPRVRAPILERLRATRPLQCQAIDIKGPLPKADE